VAASQNDDGWYEVGRESIEACRGFYDQRVRDNEKDTEAALDAAGLGHSHLWDAGTDVMLRLSYGLKMCPGLEVMGHD